MIRSAAERDVRAGVIGLGRPWAERYREALTRPGSRIRVAAVCDPVVHRAEIEADRLGCDAVEGLTAMIDRPDVEAVFLLDDPWYGSWPMLAALDRGKPVYSAIGLRATLDALAAREEAGRRDDPPVMVELPRRFRPETLRLRELLAIELGPPRRVVLHALAPRDRSPGGSPDAAIELVDWCRSVFGAEPIASELVGRADRDHRALRVVDLEFPGGGSARIALLRGRTNHPGATGGGACARLAVEAARGRARIDRSGRLRWSAGAGEVEEPSAPGPPTELMIDHFLRLVRGEQSLAPALDALLRLDRLARVFDL